MQRKANCRTGQWRALCFANQPRGPDVCCRSSYLEIQQDASVLNSGGKTHQDGVTPPTDSSTMPANTRTEPSTV